MAPTTMQRTLIIAGVIAACGAGVYALGTTQAAGATTLRPVVTLSGTSAAQTSTGVTVTGTGNATGTPNELQLSLSVNTQASSVGGALGQANQAMSNVRAALESHGVATADLQTSGMSIQPNYVQGGTTSGYQATESLTATLRDLNSAGGTVSAAVSAGGNAVRVDGVSLDLNDPGNPLLSAARASAMADAKSKAQQYAAAAGESLGSVIGITETPASTVEPYAPAAGAAASAGSSSVPVSSGSQQVSVTVTVTYALG